MGYARLSLSCLYSAYSVFDHLIREKMINPGPGISRAITHKSEAFPNFAKNFRDEFY